MNTVNKYVLIKAPACAIWSYLTEPALISLWITDSGVEVITDWQVGNPVVFKGDLHGLEFINKGIVLQFEPTRLLSYSFWSSLTEQPDLPENYSVITFRLILEGDRTRLTFSQINILMEAQLRHVNYYWSVALELIRRLCERTM